MISVHLNYVRRPLSEVYLIHKIFQELALFLSFNWLLIIMKEVFTVFIYDVSGSGEDKIQSRMNNEYVQILLHHLKESQLVLVLATTIPRPSFCLHIKSRPPIQFFYHRLFSSLLLIINNYKIILPACT